ncbi:MAG TPA: VWA domain-containing protein [bacterium]|jgi:Ca-activated chloride channel family protein|nr:VWA domain-containing protein [bacterium]HNT64478.1 VWA domain-containing protein [bacterium]HOX84675.1 VWA domain-containing protein [bacterium]HPG45398.1 VWA domain-containing protein [bacterium]HPM96826.1 VWA domain-containing protein [bacterium]
MFRFANPQALHLLWLVPILIVFLFIAFRAKKRALQRFGNLELLQKLIANTSRSRQIAKSVAFLLAIVLLLLALARPQIGIRYEDISREGIDLLIAIDVSASMLARDIQPSRLQKAKHEVEGLINLLRGDRVGLIAFAGVPFVQCPLTLDYGAAKMFLDVMDTDLIPTPGTAIGAAIRKAIETFERKERKFKVLILITDGEDHSGEALVAAEEAEREGIIIYTVGIGLPQGEPIPMQSGERVPASFKKDRQGQVVITKLDEVTLEKIALQTGGKYYRASSAEDELKKIYAEISEMEKKELGSRRYAQFEDRYQYVLGFALLLLLIETLLPERKRIRREWRGRFM